MLALPEHAHIRDFTWVGWDSEPVHTVEILRLGNLFIQSEALHENKSTPRDLERLMLCHFCNLGCCHVEGACSWEVAMFLVTAFFEEVKYQVHASPSFISACASACCCDL